MSVEFINQGSLGAPVLGHTSVEGALRSGLAGSTTIDPTFVSLPPWSPLARLAAGHWPPLNRIELDLQATRWHLVEGRRGRKTVKTILASRRPDLLHVTSHTAAFGLPGLGIPYVVNVDATVDQWDAMGFRGAHRRHGHPSSRLLGLSRGLERKTFQAAAGIVAMSEWSAAGVRRMLPDSDVRVIHPGIDVEQYAPAAQADPSDASDVVRVLFVGGRFKEKGGPLLLRAMETLQPRLGRGVELDVVTPDPVDDGPQVRRHQLPPGDARLRELFRRADVLCLPTFRDAVPWVVLEAFASGTPVVASDIGALPELIGRDSERGKVVAVGDAPALEQALQDVMDDREGWARRGRAARAYARENFDLRSQARKLDSFIQEIAERLQLR